MASRAMKLFVGKGCPYCHRAEIVALEKKVPYEAVQVELGDKMPDWYKKLNPNETVPTLQVNESKLVYESMLIAQYLDKVSSPASSLMGSTPYQRHRIEFFSSQVGDLISALYGLLRDPVSAEARKNADDNRAYIDGLLAENQTTGPFYCDQTFTMADVALLPFLVRFKPVLMYYAGYDIFAHAPHLKALWTAGKDRPSVQEGTESAKAYVDFYSHFVPDTAPMAGAKGGYVLYGNKFCPFVDRARLACAAKKCAPYWVDIELPNQPEWYKFINVRETVPTLVTPEGEYVHESQLIVHYLDSVFPSERTLLPRDDADKEYAVQYFITTAGNFTGAMYALMRNPTGKEERDELAWAAGQLEKQLAETPFGDGPFHGGSHMNAADISLLPMLVRMRACTPELTEGYDVFAAYPRLAKLLEAGYASEDAKGIFADFSVFLTQIKGYLKR